MSRAALKEAERVMTICNACRYCEGFCAVFPAMELRRTFSAADLKYLANLCHNCRGCYYACQYAPPHEFNLNAPRALAELRLQTYREAAWPAALGRFFRDNELVVTLAAALGVVATLLLALGLGGRTVLLGAHAGEGSFYRVIPYGVMVLPLSALAVAVALSLGRGVANLWREIGGRPGEGGDVRANWQALKDVLRLRYLDGGGGGCNYPDERFGMSRRYLHHAVFYGFLFCLVATTVAFVYDHLLGRPAPYPFWSWPVVLGTTGGLALLAGTAGLLYLKARMDRAPAYPGSLGLDVAFTLLLLLTSLSGLLLLLLRESAAMGILLAVHVGLVAGLFVTLPGGKFVHGLYRYAALVRNAQEQSRAEH